MSKEYRDLHALVEWRCKKAHRFSLAYCFVKQGAWCPQCTKEEQKQAKLEAYQQFAEKQGGKCLSKVYVSVAEKVKWQCKEGHIWKQAFYNIEKYGWCKECRKVERGNIKFRKAKAIAEKKGGKCLTERYISSHQQMEWQCKQGHKWKAELTHILNGHSWCPVCSGKAKHTIEQMRALAEKKGGTCLSASYENNAIKIKWRCANGHSWEARPVKIIIGQWCPVCRYTDVAKKLKADIGVMQEIARSRKGALLSKEYVNAFSLLKWKCEKGHVWQARPAYVKRGTWCPVCAIKKRQGKEIV